MSCLAVVVLAVSSALPVTATGLPVVVRVLIAFVGFVVFGLLVQLSRRSVRHGSRHRNVPPDRGSLLAGKKRFVLYLRSFADDPEMAHQMDPAVGSTVMSKRTEEQQLARAVRPIGRLIAVGEPRETLPQAGAGRFDLPLDNWRGDVLALMSTARLTLLGTGSGAGLRWEVTQAVARIPPQRLVLVVPQGETGYQHFRAWAGDLFPKGLPPFPRGTPLPFAVTVRAAVYFAPDWTPSAVSLANRGVRLNNYSVLESAFVYQLRPVYRQLSVSWPGLPLPLPRWLSFTRRQLRSFAVGAAVVLLLGAFLYAQGS
jgi:hypothetical protein